MAQASEYVGVSVATIRRLIASGKLPATNMGIGEKRQRLVVEKVDLDRLYGKAA